MSDAIAVTDNGGVRTIRMNRRKRRTSQALAMYGDITSALCESDQNDAIRCIMIAGVPGAFCAGNDITDFLRPRLAGSIRVHTNFSTRLLAGKSRWSRRSMARSGSARPCCCIATTWLLAPGRFYRRRSPSSGSFPKRLRRCLLPCAWVTPARSRCSSWAAIICCRGKRRRPRQHCCRSRRSRPRGARRGARNRGASPPSGRLVTQPDARPSRRDHQANRHRVDAFQGSVAVRRGPRRIRRIPCP